MKGKTQAIVALTHTLLEKGDHNRKLMEKLSEMKNHQLSHHFLNQWYLVSRATKKDTHDFLVSFDLYPKTSYSSDLSLTGHKSNITSLRSLRKRASLLKTVKLRLRSQRRHHHGESTWLTSNQLNPITDRLNSLCSSMSMWSKKAKASSLAAKSSLVISIFREKSIIKAGILGR